ncbi:ankyrin repeat-containing domain protein [Xylariaceae sp. FL1272]|nr:ankyrin repeat-containing domain protein [Xylariaceae sp. FL1272]
MLVERGANMETMDDEGMTPLARAVACAQYAAARVLIEKHPAVGAVDSNREIVSMRAARKQMDIAVQLLLEAGANPNETTPFLDNASPASLYRRSHLFRAVRNQDEHLVGVLLEAGGNPHGTIHPTPLEYAVLMDLEAMVKLMHKHGVDVDRQDGLGTTPLMTAVRLGHPSMVRTLVECGSDTTKKDIWGTTALELIDLMGYEV